MGFFSREPPDDLDSLPEGGLPEGALPRSAQHRQSALGQEGSLFTSGLSVNEFALLRLMGPQPVAQVMGASVMQVGWQYLPALSPGVWFSPSDWSAHMGRSLSYPRSRRAWQTPYTEASPAQVRAYKWRETVVCELTTITDAWSKARRQALDRLTEEALRVGADAVVGVRLQRGEYDHRQRTVSFVVLGTAIRTPGREESFPVLSDLSVQDYWRLVQAGHEPVGLLATTSVVFASPSRSTRLRRIRTARENQELVELSRGFQAARETVRNRLAGQVSDCHGSGAVGVTLSHTVHEEKLSVESSLSSHSARGWQTGRLGIPYLVSGASDLERGGWVIAMHGAGTAIRSRPQAAGPSGETVLGLGAPR